MGSIVLVDGMPHCRIDALRIGQRVDLEGDMFADPDYYASGDPDTSEHPEFQYEFEVVAAVEPETPECTLAIFESGYACGFPPDHLVSVDGEQTFDEES